MHFLKFKYIYLALFIFLATAAFVFQGSLYEVVIDIIVNPPADTRKTDFSWITVNEWFVSQTHLVTSYSILKEVKTDIPIEKLKKIVTAKRMGASDIIRISATSEDSMKLAKLVDDIASVYLKDLALKSAATENKKNTVTGMEKGLVPMEKVHGNTLRTLLERRVKAESESKRLRQLITIYETELKKIEREPSDIDTIRRRISDIDNTRVATEARLAKLMEVYTDSWPEVANAKARLTELKSEKDALSTMRDNAQKLLNRRTGLSGGLRDAKADLSRAENELAEINQSLDMGLMATTIKAIENGDVSENADKLQKEIEKFGYVINPPNINYLPNLEINFLLGLLTGSSLWVLLFLLARIRK